MASISVYSSILASVKNTVITTVTTILGPAPPVFIRKFAYISEADRPLPLILICPEKETQTGADMASPPNVYVEYPVLIVIVGSVAGTTGYTELQVQDWMELRDSIREATYTPTLSDVPEVYDVEFEWADAYDNVEILKAQYEVTALRLLYFAQEPRN